MAYDIISQLRGPEVDVSLYPRSYSAGVAAGNAQKTIPEAIVGGIQTGLEIQQQFQQNQIRQNQIEQQPVENRIREAQADRQEITAELEALELERAQAEQSAVIRLKAQEAKDKLAQARAVDTDLRNREEIEDILGGGDLTTKRGLLYNPSYMETLRRDPKYMESVVGTLAFQKALTPEEERDAYKIIDFGKTQQFAHEKAKSNISYEDQLISDLPKLTSNITSSGPISYAAEQGKFTNIEEYKNRIKIYPKGTKVISDINGAIVGDTDNVQAPEDAGQSTLFLDNKRLLDFRDADLVKDYNRWKTGTTLQEKRLKENLYGPQAPVAKPPTPTNPTSPQNVAPTVEADSLPPNPAGNLNIIEKNRAKVEDIKRRLPSGLSGSIEDGLKQRKALIRSGVADLQSQRAADLGVTALRNEAQTAPELTPAPTATVPPAPNQALSSAMKVPVSLRVDNPSVMQNKTWGRVWSDPLLANEPPLIKGLASVESGGRRNALSPTGVRGLLQVTKATASMYGLNRDIPEENVTAGKLYLYDNLLRFNGNLHLSLAAYNAGHGTISDAIRNTQSTNWEDIKGYLKENLSPAKYREVASYPDKVLSHATQFLGNGPSDTNFMYMLDQNGLIKVVKPPPNVLEA